MTKYINQTKDTTKHVASNAVDEDVLYSNIYDGINQAIKNLNTLALAVPDIEKGKKLCESITSLHVVFDKIARTRLE